MGRRVSGWSASTSSSPWAHPVGRQKPGDPQDHRHRLKTIRPYEYQDAATLLADFWAEVDAVLKQRGVLP